MTELEPAPETQPAGAALRLQLCGTPAVLAPGGAPLALSATDAALLAYLAIEGPTSRQRMLALLWPDESAELVRNRLRQRLFALKRRLGIEAVTGTLTLALSPALQWPGFAHEASERPFLGDVADAAELGGLADWLAAVRERLQAQRRERLAAQASVLEQQGRLDEAIVAAGQLLALEPCLEHAHRRLMRLHYLRGDRAAALRAFDHCEQVLKHEVGATPSPETLELLAQIDRVGPPRAPSPRLAVPATVLRPPRLVGRDAEWVRLQAAWERGQGIVLIGEAGMGKTRLLADLLRAQARPGSALLVAARPGDERVPYALWSRLLRSLLARRSQPMLPAVQAELARLLPELPQAQRQPGIGHDDAARTRFIGALQATLADAVAAGLCALALDDLHFADAASLELAQQLAGSAGLRWLVAFRGAEAAAPALALADTLCTRLQAETVTLGALAADAVAELVGSLGIVALDAPALAAVLHQRSGGNPLFLLETLKALLLGTPGAPDVRALAALPASGPIGRLIARRLGQLSREALQLARCAAVAGQDFSAALAAHVLEVKPQALAPAWAELETAQMLRDGAFAHDLVGEAALSSVPAPIARELHRRVAAWLQAQQAAPARVAAHWLAAGEALHAAPQLAEAGRQALRALRLREGLDYLDQAQAIHGQAGDADAQCALIDELISPAMLASSFEHVQRLVEQATQNAGTERQHSMTLRSLGSLLAQRCEYDRATEIGRQALDWALAARDRACELGARSLLAEVLAAQCQSGEAESMLQPIEAWVHEHGSGAQRLVYVVALAKVLHGGGQVAQALDQWQRAIDIARQTGAAHALPDVLMARGGTLWLSGRVQEARDSHIEGWQLLRDVPGDAVSMRTLTIQLQILDRQLGHYTSSLAHAEQVLTDPAAGAGEIDEVRLAQAFAFCDLGQPTRVRQLLSHAQAPTHPLNELLWKEVAALPPQPAAPHVDARRLALGAAADAAGRWTGRNLLTAWRIQARLADDDQAVAAARRGADVASACGIRGQQLVFQALLAQRLARLGDKAQAVRLARDSWQLMTEFCPGMVYRGVVWQALLDVLRPHDAALGRVIARSAAEWIGRTAAEQVPPGYRDGFLRLNPFNASLLAAAAAA